MNRRLFAGALITTSFFLPANASAQESSPVASPAASPAATAPRNILSDQPGFVRAVLREFKVTEAGYADVLEGGLVLLQTSGAAFDRVENASQALDYLTTAFPESLGASEVTRVSLDEPGDEQVGLEVRVTPQGQPGISEIVVVIAITRKDRFLQVLLGGGLEPGWDTIHHVADAVGGRWPAEDLWRILPGAGDVPPGLAIAEEREILPGE